MNRFTKSVLSAALLSLSGCGDNTFASEHDESGDRQSSDNRRIEEPVIDAPFPVEPRIGGLRNEGGLVYGHRRSSEDNNGRGENRDGENRDGENRGGDYRNDNNDNRD